jgi:glycosyltransferase involved in cell wall biosynthesis
MDLCCFIPFYTTQLCQALKDEHVDATLGSIRYYLQPDYFHRIGLRNNPGLVDVVGRFSIGSKLLRRILKVLECCLNLSALAVRFLFSKPDVLHVQYLALLDFGIPVEYWFLRFAKLLRIRIVHTVHNVLPPDNGEPRRQGYGRVYRLADLLICHGDEARTRLIKEFGIGAEKIVIVPHGPMFENARSLSQQEARAALGFSSEEVIILCFGVISPYKGVDWLLAAWHQIRGLKNARLVIAGTGDPALLASIESRVQALGIADSVHLHLKFVPVEMLPSFYQSADVIVYPYREITTSGAIATGIGYGKAIIATRLPAFRELLRDGETALFVDYGNVEGLGAALAQLIQDPKLRVRLADNVAALSRRWSSWEAIAERTRQCYEAVLPTRVRARVS